MYSPEIIQRNLNPLNKKILPEYSFSVEKNSSQCGDRIELYLKIENGIITDAGYIGEGCAISQASTDLMIDEIKGKTILNVLKLIRDSKKQYIEDKRASCYLLGWEALEKILRLT